MAKKLTLEKLLTTASAIALIAGAASNAFGAEKVSQNDPSDFNTSTDWTPEAVLQDQDYITLGGSHEIDASLGVYVEDIAGTDVLTELVALASGVVVGNITTAAPTPGVNGNIEIRAGNEITLVGGDRASRTTAASYSGLNAVDFNGAGAILTIDTSVAVDHHISGDVVGAGDAITFAGDVTNGANGTLNVNTSLNTLDGAWFDIDTINIGTANAAATWATDLLSTKTTVTLDGSKINFLHADSVLSIDSASTIDINGSFGGGTDLLGNLSITTQNDTSTATINDNANGSFGVSNTQRLSSLTIQGTQSITANVPIYSKDIIVDNALLTFNDVIDSGTSSSFTFQSPSSFLAVDDVRSVTFNKDVTVTTMDLNDFPASINVADGKTITANIVGDLGDANAVNGTLSLDGDTNFVGAATSLSTIIGGASGKTANLGAGDHTVTEIQISHANGTIEFTDGANVKIDGAGNGGAINSTGGAAGTLTFLGSSTVEGTVGANTAPSVINANGDANSTVTFDSAVEATTLTIGAGTVELGDDFTGNIEAAVDTVGTLNFTGNSTVTGTVGATNALATINANGDANSTVTFSDDVTSTNLNIGAGTVELDSTDAAKTLDATISFTDAANGKLLITGVKNSTIVGDIATATTGRGIVEIDASVGTQLVNFKGQIGDNTNDYALNLLDIKGDSTVKFLTNTNVHINKINLDADATIRLAKSNAEYLIDEITNSDGNGTLYISEHAVLKSNGSTINFGTSDARFKALEFRGSQTLTIEDGVNIYVNTYIHNNGETLIFKGESTLDIVSSGGKTVEYVIIEPGAKLTFVAPSDTVKPKGVVFTDEATLILNDNFGLETGGHINSEIAGKGTMQFSNLAPITIISTIGTGYFPRIGDGAPLGVIEFAGSDVNINGELSHTDGTFKFTSDDAMKVTFSAASSVGDAIFTNESNATHTIILGNALTSFSKDLATSTSSPLNFQLDDSIDAEITAGDATGTNFTTGTDGKGELNLNNTGVTLNKAGSSSLALGKITFTESGTITNGVYATTITVEDAKTATLGGTISGTTLLLNGATVTAAFTDGATINPTIDGDSAGNGILNFAGDATITGAVGNSNSLAAINANGGGATTVTFNSAVEATTLTIGAGTVKLDNDFTGKIEANIADAGTLNFTGDSTVTGTVGATNALATINANGDANSTVAFSDDVTSTNLNIGAGTIELDSTAGAKALGADISFTDAANGKLLITGANNATIAGNMATATTDRGIVEIDASVGANTVTVQGQIGDNAGAEALNLLDIKGDSTVKFNVCKLGELNPSP